METPEEKLRNAFAGVIYALAKIDGEVQQVEIDVFKEQIAKHEWGKNIEIAFDKEYDLNEDAKVVFLKAMKVFRAWGPSEHYPFFIDLLEKIAEAHEGVVEEERKLIDRFKQGLIKDVNSSS